VLKGERACNSVGRDKRSGSLRLVRGKRQPQTPRKESHLSKVLMEVRGAIYFVYKRRKLRGPRG